MAFYKGTRTASSGLIQACQPDDDRPFCLIVLKYPMDGGDAIHEDQRLGPQILVWKLLHLCDTVEPRPTLRCFEIAHAQVQWIFTLHIAIRATLDW